MKFLKHLKTFEFFSNKFEEENVLTYSPNGHHIWDAEDTIISLYYFRMVEKNSMYEDIHAVGTLDRSDLERELVNSIGLDSDELAEDIIGCNKGALITNAKVIEHIITGRETGYKNANIYQRNLSQELKDATVEELKPMVEEIITNIENNDIRISQNKEVKKLRTELKEINANIKAKSDKIKNLETQREMEKQRDFKASGVKKAKSMDDIEAIEVRIGSIINSEKFGRGEVVEIVTNKISKVRFENGVVKTMGNSFIIRDLVD